MKHDRLIQYLRQLGGIFLSLVVLCVFFSLANNRFMSVANFMNILQQVSVVAIVAFGMTWVILLGEIDLSVGSIIAVTGMVGAQVLALDYGFIPALLITLFAGALLGFINGALTAKLALPSFIVTVATMGIYRGMVSLPTNGAPQMITNDNWTAIGNETWLGIPVVIWILFALFLINHIVLARTVFGRRAYLTGGNIEAAQYSGIQTVKVKIWIFTLSGRARGMKKAVEKMVDRLIVAVKGKKVLCLALYHSGNDSDTLALVEWAKRKIISLSETLLTGELSSAILVHGGRGIIGVGALIA